jgi:hypothetical protein
MVESYTSFSADIHVRFRGNFAIHPPGESYAKFKSVQTLPYHYFQLFFVILAAGFKKLINANLNNPQISRLPEL